MVLLPILNYIVLRVDVQAITTFPITHVLLVVHAQEGSISPDAVGGLLARVQPVLRVQIRNTDQGVLARVQGLVMAAGVATQDTHLGHAVGLHYPMITHVTCVPLAKRVGGATPGHALVALLEHTHQQLAWQPAVHVVLGHTLQQLPWQLAVHVVPEHMLQPLGCLYVLNVVLENMSLHQGHQIVLCVLLEIMLQQLGYQRVHHVALGNMHLDLDHQSAVHVYSEAMHQLLE